MRKLLIFDFSGTLVEVSTKKVLVTRKKLLELKDKGYLLALFTAMSREGVEDFLSAVYKEIFDLCVFSEDVEETKPSPEGVIKIMNELKPKKTIYIGDSENDFKAAVSAGVGFLTPDLIYLL